LASLHKPNRLLLKLKRVSRPNLSIHENSSKTDYTPSALGDVFRGQGHDFIPEVMFLIQPLGPIARSSHKLKILMGIKKYMEIACMRFSILDLNLSSHFFKLNC
jgi:hypothetical protein